MMNRTIYLVRHGQRIDALNKDWYKAENANRYDPPLSAHGIAQAQALAPRIAHETIHHIFVSPYIRAIQTAQPLAEALNKPFFIESGVGEWLGKSLIPHEPDIIAPESHLDSFSHLSLDHQSLVIPQWPETEAQCFDRLRQTMTYLLEYYSGNFLIVGHGRTVTGIAHVLTGKPESFFKYDLACLTSLTFEQGQWQVRLNGDTTHLQTENTVYYV